MNTKNNQRFHNTEKKLEQTFLCLCKTTLPEKITVSQLCKAVEINRSTFYEHYLDIPDLIYKIGVKHIGGMIELLRLPDNSTDFPFSDTSLIQLFTYIKEHQDFFNIYFNHSNPRTLLDSLSNLLESACNPYMNHFRKKNDESMQYHFAFFKAGFIAILSRWVFYKCKETPEEIANILLQNLPGPKK